MAEGQPSEEEIFQIACEITSRDAQQAYLDQACGEDEELKERLRTLLRVDAIQEPDETSAAIADRSFEPPKSIGPYKLLQKLGEGGMGVVYMAEQKTPLVRRVALKIIKPGMDSRQVIARFEAERQALAMMDHPNIAKVLDAGQTESGHPYFVMELVNGIPITKFCDQQHLTPKERLELFVPVCQGVQHAHQKGVIHRDLKPGNILVALYDSKPVHKIIDFGVAKATSQSLTEKTMFTQLGQVIGTLEYMSPEQSQRNQLDIDTRTDIYSLGVVLYELLTGELPLDRTRLRTAGYDEIMRIIREEEPAKPSTRVSSSAALPSIAANRRVEPRRLAALVRGELDWIVMKALDKDRGRRYETANAFAGDLQRYLVDEPVEASPPSGSYRLRKLARKYRKHVVTAGAFAALLLLATAISIWLAMHWKRAQGIAVTQQEAAIEARDAKEAALLRVKAEQAATNQALRESLLQQSRALRATTETGRRSKALSAIAEAAKIQPDLDLRNEYLVALNLPDLIPVRELPYPVKDEVFSRENRDRLQAISDENERATYRRYLWSASTVSLLGSDDRMLLIPGQGRPVEVGFQDGEVLRLYVDTPEIKQPATISDDGRFLAARTLDDAGTSVWNTGAGELVGELLGPDDKPVISEILAFDPESRWLAVLSEKDGQPRVLIYELDSLRLTKTLEIDKVDRLLFVDCLCFQPGGNILAVSVIDNRTHEIRLWNVEDRTRLARLPVDRLFGGYAAIRRPQRVDFSRDGQTLVAGGQAGAVKGWDLSELLAAESSSDPPRAKEVFHNSLYDGSVSIAQLAPNGRWLATRGVDGVLRIWDFPTGRLATQTPDVTATSIDWSHSGEFLLSRSSAGLRQWQFVAPLSESNHLGSWARYDERYTTLQFNPQNDSLAFARGPSVHLIDPSSPQDSTVLERQGIPLAYSPDGDQLWGCDRSSVWNRQLRASGEEAGKVDFRQDEAKDNRSRSYTNLSVTPSGKLLIAGTENRVRLRVFNLETGAELWRDERDSRFTSLNRPGTVFSADGSQIAYRYDSEGVVKLWESTTGDLVNEYRLPDSSHLFFQDDRLLAIEGKTITDIQDERQVGDFSTEIRELTRLSISPDGQRVAWRANDQILIARPDRQADPVTVNRAQKSRLPRRDFMVFNRSGSRLAAFDGPHITVWNVDDGAPIATCVSNPVAITFLDDESGGEGLILVGRDRSVLQWSVDATNPGRSHKLDDDEDLRFSTMRHPVFSADSERLVYLTVEDDAEVCVWETRSGRQVSRFPVDFRADLSGRAYTVSPDGKLIALLEGFHVQKVWDYEKLTEIADLGQVPRTLTYPYRYVGFSPDGSKLSRAIRLPSPEPDTDKYQVEVLSVATGRVTLAHRSTDLHCFDFAGDGVRFAVAEEDRIIIFNQDTGQRLATIGDLPSGIIDIAFDRSGDLLCAVSADDRKVTLWNTNTSDMLATFQSLHANLVRVAISPDGAWITVGASNGNVQTWNLHEIRHELKQVSLDWSE